MSPVLRELYAGRRDEAETLAGGDARLDVFEAAALGRTDRLAQLLRDDPEGARGWSPDGFTALHLAAFFGAPAAARMLVEHGAAIDAVAMNEMRVTPLHSAAAARQTEISRLLIARGADVHARQEGGFTPLHAAAQNGDGELVEILLSHGAGQAVSTDGGKTAAALASEAGHAGLAERLT